MNCLRFTSHSLIELQESLAILGAVMTTEDEEFRARNKRLRDREEALRQREEEFWAMMEEQERHQVRRTRKKDKTSREKIKNEESMRSLLPRGVSKHSLPQKLKWRNGLKDGRMHYGWKPCEINAINS